MYTEAFIAGYRETLEKLAGPPQTSSPETFTPQTAQNMTQGRSGQTMQRPNPNVAPGFYQGKPNPVPAGEPPSLSRRLSNSLRSIGAGGVADMRDKNVRAGQNVLNRMSTGLGDAISHP